MIVLNYAGLVNFLHPLINFDHWLFFKINREWTNSFFDFVLPWVREAEFWYPFYLFLLVFILMNFGKKGGWWAVTLIFVVIISDLASSHLIKELIYRSRPCRDPDLMDQVRVLANYCPLNSSFTSSHASNHFSMAVFIFMTLKQTSKWWGLILAWACLISYAQIYVGVHFPLDILGGTILGCSIGYGMTVFFRSQFGSLSLKQ
jgi:membrane-associated phospholipid phosphatase